MEDLKEVSENLFKIDMSWRLEPMERVHKLESAFVQFNFDVHAEIYSDDSPKLDDLH